MRSEDAQTGEQDVCSPMDESILEDSEPITPPTAEERIALGLNREARLRDFLHAERWTWASFLVHGLAVYCVALLPPHSTALALDMLNDDVRYARYLTTPVEREPFELFEQGASQDAPSGEKAADTQGQAGKSDAPPRPRRMSGGGKDYGKSEPNLNARNAGILGVLAARKFVSDGPGSFDVRGVGDGAQTAFGAIMGSTIGDSFGFNGLGIHSTGRGGGGDALGSVGVGEFGRFETGLGDGCRGCVPTVKALKREARVPHLRTLGAEVVGSLSKEVIRRVIQRHANEVRFCYEESLRQAPELSGRVQVKFVIAPSGAVQSAFVASNTLAGDQARTSRCIADAVKRWSFPAPDGGSVVVVTYPFLLETAN